MRSSFFCQETLARFWQFFVHRLQDFRFPLHRCICCLSIFWQTAFRQSHWVWSLIAVRWWMRNQDLQTSQYWQKIFLVRSGWKVLWSVWWQWLDFWQDITRMVHCWEVPTLSEHFAWHVCFMDLTANRIIRLSLQNVSLIINGFREHLYLGQYSLPLYWRFQDFISCLK